MVLVVICGIRRVVEGLFWEIPSYNGRKFLRGPVVSGIDFTPAHPISKWLLLSS